MRVCVSIRQIATPRFRVWLSASFQLSSSVCSLRCRKEGKPCTGPQGRQDRAAPPEPTPWRAEEGRSQEPELTYAVGGDSSRVCRAGPPQRSNTPGQVSWMRSTTDFSLGMGSRLPRTYLLCFPFAPRSAEKAICHSPGALLCISYGCCESCVIYHKQASLLRTPHGLGLMTEPPEQKGIGSSVHPPAPLLAPAQLTVTSPLLPLSFPPDGKHVLTPPELSLPPQAPLFPCYD